MPLDSRQVVRKLRAAGWRKAGQTGDHLHFKHPEKPGKVTVPHAKKDLPRGTIRSIERQAGLKLR